MKDASPVKTAEKILNAAEKLFADYSYNEVSIRQITALAEVKLALAHYHFGSKEDLYRAVIRRRMGKIAEDRAYLLQNLNQQYGDTPIPLNLIAEAFLGTYLYNCLHGGPGWREYSIIVTRLLSSGSDLSLSILQESFDPCANQFLLELRRTRPEASEEQIQWAFDFLVGSVCNIFAEVDRINDLSDKLCSVTKPEISCQYLYNYIAAGLEGVLSQPKHKFTSVFKLLKER